MKDKRCFLCKYSGDQELSSGESILYGRKGKTFSIKLCYNHGVELFKMGQMNFTTKYGHHFQERYGSGDDDELVNLFTHKSKDIFDF